MEILRPWAVSLVLTITVAAQGGDPIGVDPLKAEQPALNGAGISLLQVEGGGQAFEVNPVAVSQPVSLFRWVSIDGTATEYPNSVGLESAHANLVGAILYGASEGVAPGIAQVDNYEALHFYNSVVVPRQAPSAQIVNQSFVFTLPEQIVNQAYDDYAATYNVLFVSGAGNDGTVMAPASAYNGVAVAAYGGASSIGPTADNGRAKPDLTTPAAYTSYAAPAVAGAAALLWQAAAQGIGGSPSQTTNALTIKALLLNGAVKPSGWTNGVDRPLDPRHGAGLLNAYHSFLHLAAGQHSPVELTTPPAGSAHPPGLEEATLNSLRGWDRQTVTSSVLNDLAAHYYFDLPSGTTYSLAATLVWARHVGQVNINNLDLFLFDAATGSLVASSISSVDNVEHIFAQQLLPGRYDLQVLKHGGPVGVASQAETYAMGFHFSPERLEIIRMLESQFVAWPVSSAGFSLQSSFDLLSWQNIADPVLVSEGMNKVLLGSAPALNYRLAQP